MRVVPVIDVLNGQVVHAIAGRRNDYRPIASHLSASSQPLEVARAIRDTFDLNHFYVADLDGILKQRPGIEIYQRLLEDGFDLVIDAGVRDVSDAITVHRTGANQVIIGLETCDSPDRLASITACPIEIIFSLDLLDGNPQVRKGSTGWSDDPRGILQQAVNAKVNSLLLLDLADVGMNTGGSTESLCLFVRSALPNVRLITGGGVRGIEDLMRFESLGVNDVLVASALHDGRISHHDVKSFL